MSPCLISLEASNKLGHELVTRITDVVELIYCSIQFITICKIFLRKTYLSLSKSFSKL